MWFTNTDNQNYGRRSRIKIALNLLKVHLFCLKPTDGVPLYRDKGPDQVLQIYIKAGH